MGNARGDAQSAPEEIKRSAAPHHASVVYRRSAKAAEHLAELASLHVNDKTAERRKKVLAWCAGIVIVPNFLLFFFSHAPVFLVGLGVGGVLLIVRAVLGKHDLDDRKLHAARHLLHVLASELKADRPATVHLDFGSYAKTKPLSKTGSFGQKALTYEKPDWLKMRLTLLDGSQLTLRASTKVKRKTKAKRKHTKIKDRIVEELEIAVAPPKGRDLDVSAEGRLAQRFRGAHTLALKRCRLKPRLATFVFCTQPALRVRARNVWLSSPSLKHLLDGAHVLEAVIASYKATATEALARRAA